MTKPLSFLATSGLIILGIVATANADESRDASPAQIVGTISFANQNPVIVEKIKETGMESIFLKAEGTNHSAKYVSIQPQEKSSAQFSIDVDAEAPGNSYKVSGYSYLNNYDVYHFDSVMSSPLTKQSHDSVNVTLEQCAGMVDVHFTGPDGKPHKVKAGSINAQQTNQHGKLITRASSNFYNDDVAANQTLLLNGSNQHYLLRIALAEGDDIYTSNAQCSKRVQLSCDQVVQVECVVDNDRTKPSDEVYSNLESVIVFLH